MHNRNHIVYDLMISIVWIDKTFQNFEIGYNI